MEGTKEIGIAKIIAEEKYKFVLFGFFAFGIAMGSISCAVYGSSGGWNGIVEAYCGDYIGTAISMSFVTVGFIIAVFLCGMLKITRLLIYPAVCFRAMGLGSLICGIIQAGGIMGLCFAALVTLPYAVVNSALAVYAGECSLGIYSSFGQKNSGLTKGLVLHTLKIFAACLFVSILSCVLFVASCMAFGKYLL